MKSSDPFCFSSRTPMHWSGRSFVKFSRRCPQTPSCGVSCTKSYPALYIEADAVPEELKALGAGSGYHIAVLSPYGLTPLVTIDPVGGNPSEVVNEIVVILERLLEMWR